MTEISIAEGVILELEYTPTCSRIIMPQISNLFGKDRRAQVHQERNVKLLEDVKDNMKFKINIGERVLLAVHVVLFASVFSDELND